MLLTNLNGEKYSISADFVAAVLPTNNIDAGSEILLKYYPWDNLDRPILPSKNCEEQDVKSYGEKFLVRETVQEVESMRLAELTSLG